MESKSLVKRLVTKVGFSYQAEELALAFIDNLHSSYLNQLRDRAIWVVENYSSSKTGLYAEVFNRAFDRWASEFQFKQLSIASKP